MGVYARGNKLWVRYKDELGLWVSKPSPYWVGDEANAQRFFEAIDATCTARRTGVPKKRPLTALDIALIDYVPHIPEMCGEMVYAIALWPDVAPRRLKVGYTRNIRERLTTFGTTCPRLVLLAYWASPDEGVAHYEMTLNAKRVDTSELFDVDDVPSILKVLDSALGRRVGGASVKYNF